MTAQPAIVHYSSDSDSLSSRSTLSRERVLPHKMKSTSDIGNRQSSSGVGDSPQGSSFDQNEKVMELIKSFGNLKAQGSSTNHFRTSDLDNETNINIEDSHTSYRKLIEREITELKVKLAEAQEKADTLQNNFNRVSIEKGVLQASLNGLVEKYDNTKRHCDELGAVVVHFQENAKESSAMKRLLEERVERSNKDYQILQRKNKQLRHQNRKLERQLKLAGSDLEGRGMENQGLKSENDWLKKQLQEKLGNIFSQEEPDDLSDLGESSDDEKVEVTGIHELLSMRTISRSTSLTRRRMSNARKDIEFAEEGKHTAEEGAELVFEEMDEYSSFGEKNAFSIDVSSTVNPRTSTRSTPRGSISANNANNNELQAVDSTKSTPNKWSWWSPFDMGTSQANLNVDYEEGDEGKLSDSLIMNYPPQPESMQTSQHKAYAEPSAKRLVPKRLNDIQ